MAGLSSIPQCGVDCLVSSLYSTHCNVTDTACLCADTVYAAVVHGCVLGNCTIKEALVVQNETSARCGFPEPNEDTTILALQIVLFPLVIAFFLCRMLGRAVGPAPWGPDDFTIILAFIGDLAFITAGDVEEWHGIGRNIWTLSPEQITLFAYNFYIFTIVYGMVLALIKSSICFLYLRIFPDPKFRRVVWATQAFNLAMLLATLLTYLLGCRPLSYFWDGWDGEHQGYCVNVTAFTWAHAAINVALDLWMLALPASQVWKLNVNRKRKIAIFTMFGFGIFLTIASIIRMKSISDFSTNTSNATRDYWYIALWSEIELTTGVIVACMPATRAFVVHCLSAARGNIRPRSRPTEAYVMSSGESGGDGSAVGVEAKGGGGAAASEIPLAGGPDGVGPGDMTYHAAGRSRTGGGASHHLPLGHLSLDRNRRYSMRVTVSSTGRFGSAPEGPAEEEEDGEEEKEEEDEEDGRAPSHKDGLDRADSERELVGPPVDADDPARTDEPAAGEETAAEPSRAGTPLPLFYGRANASEDVLAAAARAGVASEIWVRQDVSVTRSSCPARFGGRFLKPKGEEKLEGPGGQGAYAV